MKQYAEDFIKRANSIPKFGLRPLSLAYLTMDVTQNGQAISTGLEWGRDVQISRQSQDFQASQNNINRDWQSQMQQNSFQNQKDMQNSNFDFQRQMQAGNFQHDFDMQGRNFAQQTKMQSNDFDFQKQMQQSTQDFTSQMSDKTFSQNKALASLNIAGNIANTVTGGVMGLAGTVASKGFDMYMQNKNMQNQKDLITQQSNQAIQTSGSSAAALKLAT